MFTKKFICLLNIIDDCTYNCRYCYNIKPYTKKIIDLNIIYDKLKLFQASYNKTILLNITGGEPTLHPQLISFCQKLNTINNIYINIYSNMSCNYQYILSCLKCNNNLNFIFTCHDNNINFINIINKLNSVLHRIEFNIIYEDYDVYKSIDIYNKLKKYANTSLIKIFNTKTYIPCYSQNDLQLYKNITDCKENINDLSINYSEEDLSFSTDKYKYKYWKCYAASQSLYIHNDGKCYYCPGYYFENKFFLYNIYNSTITINRKYNICQCDHCPNYIDIEKYKIFNK